MVVSGGVAGSKGDIVMADHEDVFGIPRTLLF